MASLSGAEDRRDRKVEEALGRMKGWGHSWGMKSSAGLQQRQGWCPREDGGSDSH
jgi:hypothetical protein